MEYIAIFLKELDEYLVTLEASVKNKLDSLFFTRLFVPRTSQISSYPTRETAFAAFSCGSSNVNVLGMEIKMILDREEPRKEIIFIHQKIAEIIQLINKEYQKY